MIMVQTAGPRAPKRSGGRASRNLFFGVCALLFAATSAGTVVWTASMSAAGAMPMPGGRTMSMVWTPGPEQPWLAAAASFLGMWMAMTVAMMLPTVTPTLWRYRQALGGGGAARPGLAAALAGAGYFSIWLGVGAAVFALGATLAAAEMRQPLLSGAAPFAAGAVVLLAGCSQLTAAKARGLARCRELPSEDSPSGAVAAFRHGLRLAVGCVRCCGGLMAVLLMVGITDVGAMAAVAAAIAAERLAPSGERVARAVGALTIAAGLFLIWRAAGLR